ncbi:MAG: lipid hydroperoxide peroxidase [Flavobacterium sp. BFFFF1]|uniref:thiol peroxidase n=1 Tax=Flavobacterium sp. BFFFF1 TaxID=2015557 RepID=UPI000BD61EFC|nr:thiol peroxidase [Flavobacterium sp. BFFFF1]OYU79467.1 MAG: lipid hydroperoxide peroxidase [Flavobacterium sp. BFFFF1]
MASVTLGGNAVNTNGALPVAGAKAPNFQLVKDDLSTVSLEDFSGKQLVLNIFPSIDTGVCATSVRSFNEKAANLKDTVVLCISRDLPFAQKRFCGAENISNVMTLSDFRDGAFGKDYGVELVDSGFAGLHARAVVVVGTDGNVKYSELVPEIGNEPNYDSALNAL